MPSGGGRVRRRPERFDEQHLPTAFETKAAKARSRSGTRKSPRLEEAVAAATDDFDYDNLFDGIFPYPPLPPPARARRHD